MKRFWAKNSFRELCVRQHEVLIKEETIFSQLWPLSSDPFSQRSSFRKPFGHSIGSLLLHQEPRSPLIRSLVQIKCLTFGRSVSSFLHPATYANSSALTAVWSQDHTDLNCSVSLFISCSMYFLITYF